MEHISTASSTLWLGDKQYALNIDESCLSAEPPSAQIDVTDPQNGQSWSITLNRELLRSLGNDELPQGFGAFFKLVKIALLLEKETTTFSYNFGTDTEKQEGIRGKHEAISGDSLYITISAVSFADPVVFTLVLPQDSPPQFQLDVDLPAGTMAMMAEIRRSNEVLVKENEANKSKIEMLNAEVDELRGTIAMLKRDHEELLNVIAGSWNVWLKQTPATEVGKLRDDLIALKEGKKSQALKAVLFEPLEAQVEDEKVKAAEEKRIAEEEAKKIPPPFHDSRIVDKPQQLQLNSWYGKPQQKWKLLYRGSEHGFTTKSFHQNCDNKGPTMVMVKNTQNYIFGGYASISWSSAIPNKNYAAASSFVFTLVNPSGTIAKFDITANQDKALVFNPNYGPVFGSSDFDIADCCHQDYNSYSILGGSYSGSGAQQYLLVGRRQFQVDEYEVFGFA